MNYPETLKFLFESLPVWEQKGAAAYKPGLERIAAFLEILGLSEPARPVEPHPTPPFLSKAGRCCADRRGEGKDSTPGTDSPEQQEGATGARFSRKRYVHVAGTNGKGSTCHMLAAILQEAGYKTGLYTSPHLVDFRERIRVDGAMIPEEAVVEFTEKHHKEMLRPGLTFFEMATAMALWWFAQEGCDVAVIEAGLGGRLDTTNIIVPAVSVITNIGLEHTQYLGDTIAAIAGEKAGIIKPGVPVVIGETDPESAPVFRARAAALGSEIVFADATAPRSNVRHDKRGPGVAAETYDLDLAGDYQQKNLDTVLATVDILRRTLPIPDAAVRTGLQNAAALTGLRGRWEVLQHHPLTVLDTAHNAHGFAGVARQIARQNYDRLFMVLGFAADKDLASIVPLLPEGAHYILTRADTPRAMKAETLALRLAELFARPAADNRPAAAAEARPAVIEVVVPVSAAVERALSLASPRDMIYIGGSNFVVGDYLAAQSSL